MTALSYIQDRTPIVDRGFTLFQTLSRSPASEALSCYIPISPILPGMTSRAPKRKPEQALWLPLEYHKSCFFPIPPLDGLCGTRLWENLIYYNTSIRMEIQSIDVIFMDGTSVTIEKNNIVRRSDLPKLNEM